MITLTRINNMEVTINCDLIEYIEITPDTIITLTNGKKWIVKESKEDVIAKVIEFKRKIFISDIQ